MNEEISIRVHKLLTELKDLSEYFYYDDEYEKYSDILDKAIERCEKDKTDRVYKEIENEEE